MLRIVNGPKGFIYRIGVKYRLFKLGRGLRDKFYLLMRNVHDNNINAIGIMKAVTGTKESSKIKLFLSESNTAYSLKPAKHQKEAYEEVSSTTIWEICSAYNISRIDILKCDIEGAERGSLKNYRLKLLKR